MSQIEIENVILMSIAAMVPMLFICFLGFLFFIFVPRCARVDAN